MRNLIKFTFIIMLFQSILAFKNNKDIHSLQRFLSYAIAKRPSKNSKVDHSYKSYFQYTRNYSLKSYKDNNGKDYIDVEIIEDNSDKSKENLNSIKRKDDKSDSSGLGLFKFIQNTSQSAINKLSSLISDKEEDTKLKLKKQQKKQLNNQIDKVFENVGITGSIMGSAVKFMSNMMIDTISDQSSDIELVQLKVKELIENDNISKNLIGYPVDYSMPQQVSISSTNINGIQTKNVYLRYSVTGNINNGQVEVQAMIDRNNVIFKPNQIILQTSSGKTHNVSVTNNKSGGKGDIIDVQAL